MADTPKPSAALWNLRRTDDLAKLLLPGLAREEFLATVEELAPGVRQSLSDDVWPAYGETFKLLEGAGYTGEDWIATTDQNYADVVASDAVIRWYRRLAERQDPVLEPLQTSLEAWMQRWNLQAPWVVETALRTIRAWQHSRGLDQWPEWVLGDPRRQLPEDLRTEPVTLRLPTVADLMLWTPTELRKRLRKVLDSHIAQLEAEAKARGLPLARNRQRTEHVKWTVRFQVLGESFNQIHSQTGSDRATLREAVEKILGFLDLPKRPATPGGRPPGSRNFKPPPG